MSKLDELRALQANLGASDRLRSGDFCESAGSREVAEYLAAAMNAFPALLDCAAAVRDLAFEDGYCWCSVAIGNPCMRGEHSPQCLRARAALAKLEATTT